MAKQGMNTTAYLLGNDHVSSYPLQNILSLCVIDLRQEVMLQG